MIPEDRVLPSNPQAERVILGTLLMDGRFYVDCAALRTEDFSVSDHRTVWKRMGDLYRAGTEIDITTVSNELGRRREMESIGRIGFLADLTAEAGNGARLPVYVDILREKQRLRQIIRHSNTAMNRAFMGEDDSDGILRTLAQSTQEIGKDDPGGLVFARDVIDNASGGLDGILNPQRGGKRTPTGFEDLDDLLSGGGFGPGQLIVVGGRPGMGKSALMGNIATNMALAENPKTVNIFSLEMTKEEIIARMIAADASISLSRVHSATLDYEEWERITRSSARIYDAPIAIDDTPAASLMDIRCKVQRLQATLTAANRPPLALVCVDYIQLMPIVDGRRNGSREQDVSALSRGLKLIAKEFEVAVMALAQLSRKPEDREDHEPRMSDLRESGAIENDADLILFPYRPEVYSPDREDLKAAAELIVAKQRNGKTGKVHLVWFDEFTRFVSQSWRREQ
jgi:replicative DNA helicase